MSIPSVPTNFNVQQGNRQVYISWSISSTATSYSVQRSVDGVNFTTLATPTANSYLDTAVTVGTLYYYQVAAVNGSGTSAYTTVQSVIPAPTAEMSLGEIRLRARQRADQVNSQFVSDTEYNSYINQSQYELYDLLINAYVDQFVATPAQFVSDGSTFLYPLPDGNLSFQNGINGQAGYVAPPFYRLMGVDLAIQNAPNAFVTVNKFNFIDRNRYVYPNTASTIYGVFNLQYRLVGSNIEFIPTPTAGQPIRLWYVPRLNQLLQDTDLTSTSISGWLEYVITDVAIKAMQKEESDVTVLMLQKQALKQRIEESATNRDVGQPDTISDTRQNGYWSSNGGFGYNGPNGGY